MSRAGTVLLLGLLLWSLPSSAKPTAFVRGNVLGESRQPVAEFQVQLGKGPSVRFKNGRYALPIPKGARQLSLTIEVPGHPKRTLELPVTPGKDLEAPEVHLTAQSELPRGVTLQGLVQDGAGRPMQGIHLRVRKPAAPYSSGQVHEARTDSSGRFQLSGLPSGNSNLTISPPEQSGAVSFRSIEEKLELPDTGTVRLDVLLELTPP